MYPNSIGYVEKYCFNGELLSELRSDEYAPIRTPCIYGYVGFRNLSPGKDFVVISRRDRRRCGRRFITRGLSDEGAAANFTETEHILQYKEGDRFTVAAHLQTRGSIPLKWEMKPDMNWEPRVVIDPDFQKNYKAAKLHISET